MAELKETDEAVEKAGKGMIPGGSKRMTRAMDRRWSTKGDGKAVGAAHYLAGRKKGGQNWTKKPGGGRKWITRSGVYKSADPISTLYAEIEKARGLIPRSGSHKLSRALNPRKTRAFMEGDMKGMLRVGAVQRYLQNRNGNERFAHVKPRGSGEKLNAYLARRTKQGIRRGRYK